ncbi:MAG: trimeric intracellular cation channel family protein [Acidobacteria bacterium]|nr:trimeric intracellular cation channel family protein [Acidobacteriota bacterium]
MDFVLTVIEVLAILASAYAGMIEAKRLDMDFVGICTAAMVTAFGGGTLRDVLLDRTPLFWVENYQYPIIVFLLSAVGLVLFKYNKELFRRRVLLVIDAVGLGMYSAVGVGIALQLKTAIFPAILIGVITATAGGVLRDTLLNKVPEVFLKSTQLYVTCSFVGCWFYVGFVYFGLSHLAGLIACIVITVALRIIAVKRDVSLPF